VAVSRNVTRSHCPAVQHIAGNNWPAPLIFFLDFLSVLANYFDGKSVPHVVARHLLCG